MLVAAGSPVSKWCHHGATMESSPKKLSEDSWSVKSPNIEPSYPRLWLSGCEVSVLRVFNRVRG